VHHKNDFCRNTTLPASEWAHEKFGTEFLILDGCISTGDTCGPYAHHGYNGIEKETIDKIKAWIKQK